MMNKEFSFDDEGLHTLSPELLSTMLDTIPVGIEVLRAVRKDNRIVDFQYVLANKVMQTYNGATVKEKNFLSHNGDKNLFDTMANVMEDGTNGLTKISLTTNNDIRFFNVKAVKFGDGVLLSYEDMTDQNLSELLRIDNWDFIEQIADSTPDIIYVLDLPERRFTYKNKRGEEILGISEEESLEKGHDILFEIIHPEDYVRHMDHYTALGSELNSGIRENEIRLKIKDQSYHWFRIRDRVFKRDKDGQAASIIGIATDIQQQKQWADEIIRHKEQLKEDYRRLTEAQAIGHVGNFDWNAAEDKITWSDEMYRIHGIPKGEEITLEKVLSLIHPDDRDDVLEKVMQCKSEVCNAVITYRLLRPDGAMKIVTRHLQSFADEKGNITHLTGTVQDVTDLKFAEQHLKEQSHYLQRIQETVPDMISVTELETWKFEYVNKETFKAHGFDPDLMAGRSFEEMNEITHFEDRQQLSEYFQKFSAASDDDVITAEYRAKDDNGQWKWFVVRGRVFQRNEEGTVTHILNIIENISERKKAEEGLKESRDLLQSVFDSATNGFSVLEAIRDKKGQITDFKYVYTNLMAETMNKQYDLVGKLYSEVHKGFKKTGLFDNLKQVVETGTTGKMELFYDEDGFNNWYSITAVKLNDGVVLSFEDITERVRSERKIKEDAHLINQIVETSPDIIYILDLNTHHVIYNNRSIAAKLGYSKQQISRMKNPFLDLLHDDDRAAMLEHLKKIKTFAGDDKIAEIEYRMKNAKGDINNWFCNRHAVFKRNEQKIPVETIGICQDITARKNEEEQKITGLTILNQTEEIAGIGSWEYDVASGKFKWSDGMYRLFNLPKDSAVTPEIYSDYGDRKDRMKIERIVSNIKSEFNDFEEVISILPPQQEKKVIRIKAVLIRDKKKNPLKMIGIDHDITQQIKASDEIGELNNLLLRKNRDLETLNAELRNFNTIASHDYKETLQILYTNLEYIVNKDGRHLSDTSKANIRRAQSAIQRMKLLTDDINNYLRLYDIGIHKVWIDPNLVLSDIIDGMKGKLETVNGSIELTPLPPLQSDPYFFALLITHLVDNSLKFKKMIASPVIKIKYSQADEMNTIPGALKNTAYTIISISDNGIGFAEEEAEKIFELFYRIHDKSRYKGSGIGLAICKKIMQMHDGFITAEGGVAAGATFNCYFPVIPEKA